MNAKVFSDLISNPHNVQTNQLSELKELVELYPYFYQVRLLYLKALHMSDDMQYETNLELAVLYNSDRQWLYSYLFSEVDNKKNNKFLQRESRFSGSYFDLLTLTEENDDDSRKSLKEIAEKLKTSRALISTEKEEDKNTTEIISEDSYKQYIKDKEYDKAVEILKKLYLIYPKKSIYFADQIRFLEKIIENSK
ncbi:hypothetical protein MASR2M117_10470 [Paludibacter sp.]